MQSKNSDYYDERHASKDIASAYFKIHCASSRCTYLFFIFAFTVPNRMLHATATLSESSHLYGCLGARTTVSIHLYGFLSGSQDDCQYTFVRFSVWEPGRLSVYICTAFCPGARMTVSIQSGVEGLRSSFRFSAGRVFCSPKCPERHRVIPVSSSLSGLPVSLGVKRSERANCLF
jgi:hypothetical protein